MLPLSFPADRPLRLLCLGAHPDDIEIGAAGTIGRLLDHPAGASVLWVVFTGEAARREEAAASARILVAAGGAVDAPLEVHLRDFPDGLLPQFVPDLKRIMNGLLDWEPDIVLTHRRQDRHQDHRVLGELAWNHFRRHVVLEYEIPKYEGDLGRPNLFVPLSAAEAGRKIDHLMTHFVSQRRRDWFRPETFEAVMRLRGLECAAAEGLAEAFHADKLRL